MKIRCQHCRKKISIDDAFAGGFCRCPYCNEIVPVPSRGKSASVEARPVRPESPQEVQQSPRIGPISPESAESLPMANPVRIQGIITIVLSGFLLLILAFGIALLMKARASQNSKEGKKVNHTAKEVQVQPSNKQDSETVFPEPAINPLTTKGIAGMNFASPVIFILDGTSSMQQSFDLGVALIRYSILAMEAGEKFNLIIACEEGLLSLSNDWLGGGEKGDERVKKFFSAYAPAGAADLFPAVARAISKRPKSIVIIANRPVKDADKIIDEAVKASVKIYIVAFEPLEADVKEIMKTLASKTGGDFRHLTTSEIMEWIDDAEPLP